MLFISSIDLLASLKDFQIAKALWKHFERHIIYRASTPAQTVLDHLSLTRDNAKTKATLSDETGYSTKHLGRLLEELSEAELINAERVQGSKAYRYWKAMIPTVDQIDIKDVGAPSDPKDIKSMDMSFDNSQKNLNENERAQSDVPNVHCGECSKWHTGACSFPGDPNCLTPINEAATNCKDFAQSEKSDKM